MADALTTTYAKLLRGSYDCLDRIVVNGYYRQAHSPGGFRIWWRRLHGGEDTLDNAHLIRMAGRFRRRLRAWAAENRVPVRIVITASRSTTLPRNIDKERRFRKDSSSSLKAGPRHRSGTSRTDSSVERSRTRTSTTSPSIFWTATGDTSQSRSAVIRHSRHRSFSTGTNTSNVRP